MIYIYIYIYIICLTIFPTPYIDWYIYIYITCLTISFQLPTSIDWPIAVCMCIYIYIYMHLYNRYHLETDPETWTCIPNAALKANVCSIWWARVQLWSPSPLSLSLCLSLLFSHPIYIYREREGYRFNFDSVSHVVFNHIRFLLDLWPQTSHISKHVHG